MTLPIKEIWLIVWPERRGWWGRRGRFLTGNALHIFNGAVIINLLYILKYAHIARLYNLFYVVVLLIL